MSEEKKPQTIFNIPAENLGLLHEKLEVLNKRARKLSVPEVTTKVLGHQQVKEYIQSFTGSIKTGKFKTVYEIEVLGLTPKLPGGWTFAGTLEHTEAGNIVRAVPGETLPEIYRTIEPLCEHCNLERRRKDTYVVKNEEGQFKQVGHNCITDFLGGANPQALALSAEYVRTIIEMGEEQEYEGGNSYEKNICHPLHYLEFVAQFTMNEGFISKSASQKYAEAGGLGLETTSSKSWRQTFPPRPPYNQGFKKIEVTVEAIQLAKEALEWGKQIQPQNEYQHNLKVACSMELVEHRQSGILASVISAYQRHLGQEAKRRESRKGLEASVWIGTVGKREEFTVTVVGEHVFESSFQYGPETFIIYRMSCEGNVVIWKTGTGSLEVGKTYTLKGTVKEHATYKEIKQTVLSRCKVIEEKEVKNEN